MTAKFSFTWLGHATFLMRTPGGKLLLFDPWLADNPACPARWKRIDQADLILLTHGHADHMGDAVSTGRATGAPIVAIVELCHYLEAKGLRRLQPMNVGGSLEILGLRVTMVPAVHTSSVADGDRCVYLGESAGFVVRLENGMTIYFAGDTALFGDMRLIRDLYSPTLAFLPIGDRFTMGPEAAARACELLGVRQVVPMHYGTYPLLTGRPERLRELVAPLNIEVLELSPGETAS